MPGSAASSACRRSRNAGSSIGRGGARGRARRTNDPSSAARVNARTHGARRAPCATTPAMSLPRPVRAPRGTELTCKGWIQEAALRMLHNNLDAEVAERPDDSSSTAGRARRRAAGRRSTSSYASCASSRTTRRSSCSRARPSAAFARTPTRRACSSRTRTSSRVGDVGRIPPARGAGPHDVRADDRRLVDLHRHAGDPAGDVRDVRRGAARRKSGARQGQLSVLTAGPRRDGGRAAARGHDGRRELPRGRGRPGAHPEAARHALRRRTHRRPRRRPRRLEEAAASERPVSIALCGNAAEVYPELCVATSSPISSPSRRAPMTRSPATSRTASRSRRPPSCERGPGGLRRAGQGEHGRGGRGDARLPGRRAPRSSTTATTSARGPRRRAPRRPSTSPASSPSTSARSSATGKGPFRWVALSGDPADIAATDEPSSRPSPTTATSRAGSRSRASASQFQGLPRASAGSATASARRSAARSTSSCARGKVKAPIVIGRDHLDCGSVASPNRETEAMKDGSDAIADWAILNALVNTAAGASWVSFHHGGGVGIGSSLHAGMVIVADGTDAAEARLERVLTCDPGMGVIRHADAGYEEAIACAEQSGIHVPHQRPGAATS